MSKIPFGSIYLKQSVGEIQLNISKFLVRVFLLLIYLFKILQATILSLRVPQMSFKIITKQNHLTYIIDEEENRDKNDRKLIFAVNYALLMYIPVIFH